MALPNYTSNDQATTEDTSPSSILTKQNQALNELVSSLNQRQNPNWFSVAGSLLNPGRTGSAGEALGNAATEVGRQQELQQQQAPNIAMIKAQLLGQQYQMGLKQQGMKMLSNIFGGGSPEEALKNLQSGNISPSVARMATPQQIVGLLSVDKDYGNALKTGVELQQTDMKNAIELLGKGVDIAKATSGLSQEQKDDLLSNLGPWSKKLGLTLPITGSEAKQPSTEPPAVTEKGLFPVAGGIVSSGFGQRKDPMDPTKFQDHESIDIAAKEGSPVQAVLPGTVIKTIPEKDSGGYGNVVIVKHPDGSMSQYSHLKDWNVEEGSKVQQGAQLGSVGSTGRSTGPHLDYRLLDSTGKPMDPTSLFQQPSQNQAQRPSAPSSGLVKRYDETPEAFKDRVKSIEAGAIKDYNEMASGLAKVNIDALKVSNADLNELKGYADYKRPDGTNPIFAPLQKRDIDSYITAANKAVIQILQEGGNVSVGNVHAHIGFNLEPVYQNLKLTDSEKTMSQRAANIISQQVINNIIANKTAAFGGSRVTNYQDQQLSALNANMNQLPNYIRGWATRRQVDNSALLELSDAYNSYVKRSYDKNQVADPRGFFTSDQYRIELPNNHTSMMNEALKRYPYK